jgi:hypothetical protein
VTEIPDKGTISLKGTWVGCEIAFLLRIDRWWNDRPWYSKNAPAVLNPLQSPHQLAIEIVYEEGNPQTQFPWSPSTEGFRLEDGESVGVVSIDRARTVSEVRILEKMSSGRVALLGASVNQSSTHQVHPEFKEIEKVWEPEASGRQEVSKSPSILREGNTLVLENGGFRVFAEIGAGFHSRDFGLLGADREIFSATPPIPLFVVRDGTHEISEWELEDFKKVPTPEGEQVFLSWRSKLGVTNLEVQLEIDVLKNGEIEWIPSLVNLGGDPLELNFTFPNLSEVSVGKVPEHSSYLLGTRNTLFGSKDLEMQQPYGGSYPLQFLDLFDSEGAGGLALRIEDRNSIQKNFSFSQKSGSAAIRVEYPHLNPEPSSKIVLPPSVFHPHPGDWHAPLERYRSWVHSAFPRTGPARLTDLFYCRRDYPLGGTGYLFNPLEKGYSPSRLIEESLETFGGIDFIDISGWAYNENTGRVGDYLTNDLGGLEELKSGIDLAHQTGTKVGLYFEGYLLDRRSAIAEKALPAWQLMGKDGSPKWWSGDMEFFTCPGVSEWRETYASIVSEVARRTGADAVYVDQYGFAGPNKACWSPSHGHPVPSNPLTEENKMLKGIRQALDRDSPHTAIYTEQVPCDSIAHWVDAAFNYGMRAHDPHPCEHPTKLPLHRFVFPEIAVVEMIGHGIRPIPVDEEDLHLCFFHGLAVWLKGRASSWFTPGFRETSRVFHPILSEYSDVFRSPDCTPLIPTLRHGLFANRFESEGKTLITLYNSNPVTLEGELVFVPRVKGVSSRDLLQGREIPTLAREEGVVLVGNIPPHEASVYLLEE